MDKARLINCSFFKENIASFPVDLFFFTFFRFWLFFGMLDFFYSCLSNLDRQKFFWLTFHREKNNLPENYFQKKHVSLFFILFWIYFLKFFSFFFILSVKFSKSTGIQFQLSFFIIVSCQQFWRSYVLYQIVLEPMSCLSLQQPSVYLFLKETPFYCKDKT